MSTRKFLLRNVESCMIACKVPLSRNSGPLDGVKVLDMTRVLAGPSCTQSLADYGAEVIKIEDTKTGDTCRQWGPFFKNSSMSTAFVSLNRNKKSVCLNFKTKKGQHLVRSLAQKCDILVENYVPGLLKKYGLDYDSMKMVAPRLIYCSITGFGSDGPYANKPGVDLIAASYVAYLDLTGPVDGEPCRTAVSTIDLMTGLHSESAILAALFQRFKTGRGRKIDTNLFATGVCSLKAYATNYLNLGIPATRMGTQHEALVPYQAFKSKNGYISTGAISDHQFVEFCKIIGRPELSSDSRFDTCVHRISNKRTLLEILEPIFGAKTTEEWATVFENSSIVFAPLNTISQLFDDPHLKAVRLVKEIDQPTAGVIKIVDSAVKFSDFTNDLRPAPMLGQHTDEVLRTELAYSDDEIENLRKDEVIR